MGFVLKPFNFTGIKKMHDFGVSGQDALAVYVKGMFFKGNEYKKLVEFLEEQDRTTETIMIEEDAQLALSRKGKTVNGERLSWLALRQVCKALSSGLASSLSDLIGLKRPIDDLEKMSKIKADPDEDFSIGEAAALYNLALKKRFGRLFGFQAVINTSNKVIEAVVGAKYRRISNNDFLSAVSSIIESMDLKFSFRSALIYDRKISIIYTLDGYDDCVLSPGILVSNSEIGDAAIKATVILIDSTDSIMSAPYGKLGRVAHSGRDLMGKLSQLVVGVSSRLTNSTFTKDSLEKRVASNMSRSLGFKGEGDDGERFKQLVEFLSDRAGMTYVTAKKCLSKTLAGPDLDNGTFSMFERSKTWPNKSVMNLIDVIVKESRDQLLLNYFSKDRLERVAWSLFFNKLPLPDVAGE
jgi:hypothetical protein